MLPLISKPYHNFIYCLDQVQVPYLGSLSLRLLPLQMQDILSEQRGNLTTKPGALLARGRQHSLFDDSISAFREHPK